MYTSMVCSPGDGTSMVAVGASIVALDQLNPVPNPVIRSALATA